MSVRAYRVLRLDFDEKPTFNCWHDTEFLEFIARQGVFYFRNYDDNGIIEVSLEVLQSALDSKNLKVDDYVRKAVRADILWAKTTGRQYVMYKCF